VGVVVKLYNQSKMLADFGIKAERFRSGSLKASGDSAFELTEEERAYIQEKVDYMAGQFFQFVADARGTSIEALQLANITSGRTFVGEQAHRVGLIDGVQSFEASALKVYDLARKYIDKKTKVSLF
jgi:ClpP class serine protease